MKKRIIVTLVVLVVVLFAAFGYSKFRWAHTEDSAKEDTKNVTTNITEENLPGVCEALNTAGLSNVDLFEQWVRDGLNESTGKSDTSGFSDADCRMTVMLLAGDSITYDKVEENYDGTYLMFDLEAIDNQEAFSVLKDKRNLFTTLFGEMPISEKGFADSYGENLKNHGISFSGKNFSVVTILFKTYEEDTAFVGHTGILVDCMENKKQDANYLFVEKIAFGEPFVITPVKDDAELIQVLSKRADYAVEAGDPAPVVYRDGDMIGELRYKAE